MESERLVTIRPGLRSKRALHCKNRRLCFANNRSGSRLLCRNAFISVMKTTELWNCDNLSNFQRLSREWTLLAEVKWVPDSW